MTAVMEASAYLRGKPRELSVQNGSLQQAVATLQRAFLPLSNYMNGEFDHEVSRRRGIIERIIAPALLQNRAEGYQLVRGIGAGSFCVYWCKDPATGETMALTHIRKEQTANWEFGRGAVGGYLQKPEQSYEGLRREALEEMCEDGSTPVFTPDVNKYVLLGEGKDYHHRDSFVQLTAYAYELSPDEFAALKAFITRNDPDSQTEHLKGTLKATGGETLGLELRPLAEIVRDGAGRFTHFEQYMAYAEVAARLGVGMDKKMPSSPIGYTVGDIFSHRHMIEKKEANYSLGIGL